MSGEVNKIAIEVVGGHLVADFFFSLGGNLLNSLAQGLQDGLRLWGKCGDVLVYVGEFLFFCHMLCSFSLIRFPWGSYVFQSPIFLPA